MIDNWLGLEYKDINSLHIGVAMKRLVLILTLAFCATANGSVCVTLPDPREKGGDSCSRGEKCCCECRYYCEPSCRCCCNPYKCSGVDNVYDEIEPSWPSRMDAPFQEELSR